MAVAEEKFLWTVTTPERQTDPSTARAWDLWFRRQKAPRQPCGRDGGGGHHRQEESPAELA